MDYLIDSAALQKLLISSTIYEVQKISLLPEET